VSTSFDEIHFKMVVLDGHLQCDPEEANVVARFESTMEVPVELSWAWAEEGE
jgi:predicted unusual protein kinase regulating ubiquinone biosynthesis (AarF/ABC1/UbiB family)